MTDIMLNYNRRMNILKELISDCDPQVGVRAIGIQRSLDRAFENKEISQEELNGHEAKLDGIKKSPQIAYNSCYMQSFAVPHDYSSDINI